MEPEDLDDPTMDKAYNLLQDRFKDFIIVACDGEYVYSRTTCRIAAKGMCDYLAHKIKTEWTADVEYEED